MPFALNSSKTYWPAIWARLAITRMSAAMMPQPPIHPTCGLKALVPHVKVVPQSGSALFISWYPIEMKYIGMKARIVTIGACRPIATTTKPSVAARLYAGAVEATPMTMLEIRPSAPALSPFPEPRAQVLRRSKPLRPPSTSCGRHLCQHSCPRVLHTP